MGAPRRNDRNRIDVTSAGSSEFVDSRVRCLFRHDQEGRITFANEHVSVRAPRFFFTRTPAAACWRFRDDLPAAIADRIEELCREEPTRADLRDPLRHARCYRALLDADMPIEREWIGPAYRFARPIAAPAGVIVAITPVNAHLLVPDFADWLPDTGRCDPMIALLHEGRVVSLCASVRITPAAHEAGVETLPAFRGCGFAADAVAAWARAVRKIGAEPFYSTSWENTGSQAVARKLGLELFGSDFHLT